MGAPVLREKMAGPEGVKAFWQERDRKTPAPLLLISNNIQNLISVETVEDFLIEVVVGLGGSVFWPTFLEKHSVSSIIWGNGLD